MKNLLSLFLLSSLVFAHGSEHVYRIQVRNLKESIAQYRKLGFEIVGLSYKNKTLDISLDEEAVNIESFLEKNNELVLATLEDADLDAQYLNVEKANELIQALNVKYPNLTSISSIGKTTQGRDIFVLKISNPNTQGPKASVVFNAAHHAREVMTPEVVTDIATSLLTSYGKDSKITQYVDNLNIYIIPQVNPDGRSKVFSGDTMWRKNTWKDNSGRTQGVDINRNYLFNFGKCGGSSGSASAQDYRGPSKGSEPETTSIMKFYDDVRPLTSLSFHSYSELVIFPYGCNGEKPEAIDRAVIEDVGNTMASLIETDDGEMGYTPGYSWDILYATDGTDLDYHYGQLGVVSYVIEVNSSNQGFQPSYKQWRDSTVTRLKSAWQYMLDRSLNGPGLELNINSSADAQNLEVKILEQKFIYGEPARKPNSDKTYFKLLSPGTYTVQVKDGKNTVEQKVIVGDKGFAKYDINL